MSKAPALQFYANDFMDATRLWDANAVGLYIRCMCIQWTQGSIPADPKLLARAIHCDRSELESVWHLLGQKFIDQGDGTLKNSRLEAVRERQQAVSGKRADAANARWLAHAKASANAKQKDMQRKVKEKEKVEVEGEGEGGGERAGAKARGPNPEVQAVIDYLIQRLNETDVAADIAETKQDRRFAAHSIVLAMRKRWPDMDPVTNAKTLIDAALANDFHRRHAMKLRYLLKHLDTIRLDAKASASNPKTQSDEERKRELAAEALRRFGSPV